MNRLLLASAVAAAIIGSPGMAQANLGPAEQATTGDTKFQVWCSSRKNDCTVEINDERIQVNNGEGVGRSKIKRIWRDKEMRNFWDRNPLNYYQDVFYVTYTKGDGSEATGKFIVLHERTASEFWNRLQTLLGADRREIGPSVEVELKGSPAIPGK